MAYELIICEKPDAAKKVAEALATGKALKQAEQGVPYYKITRKGKDIVVASAVGHLFTVAEKNKSFKYPSFDIHWVPSSDVDAKSFTKKYLNVLKKLGKDADSVTVATDYDIEGEVIGWNCVRFACKKKDGSRMKFSTLTKPDLEEAYEGKSPTLDWGQALAGETRHFLDWLYGINLSRALTLAMKNSGMYKTMSAGRVQGPALKLMVDKELEIRAFVPKPFWQLTAKVLLKGRELLAMHATERFWDQPQAVAAETNAKGKPAVVESVDKQQYTQAAPFPFDLTTLQTEAYRLFGISPKETLSHAQDLYTAGYISYPRTSSQKLPKEIRYDRILVDLKKQDHYRQLATEILAKPLSPVQGKKDDPAHPAIFPTGVLPKLSGREEKIYDLVVKRFLACFSEPAVRETVTITLHLGQEPFLVKGSRTTKEGWHRYYMPYVRLEEEELPACQKGERADVKELLLEKKETTPPKRFTPASVIKELEKRNLGTKATRADIIEALYNRGYIQDTSIKATEVGIKTIETLKKYCPEIVDEKLTRHFEIEMDKIREKLLTEEQILDEAKKTLTKLLEHFRTQEKQIGTELQGSYKEHMEIENTIGPCKQCGKGTLKILYSPKIKKKFIGCSAYPDCTYVQNLPVFGFVRSARKMCLQCGQGMILVLGKKRRQEICFNQQCPSRAKTPDEQKLIDSAKSGEKLCPKCTKPLVVRNSVFGTFLGCSGFPKCRFIERAGGFPRKKKAEEGAAVPAEGEAVAPSAAAPSAIAPAAKAQKPIPFPPTARARDHVQTVTVSRKSPLDIEREMQKAKEQLNRVSSPPAAIAAVTAQPSAPAQAAGGQAPSPKKTAGRKRPQKADAKNGSGKRKK